VDKDLGTVVQEVLSAAHPGESLEVVADRSIETEVRAYEGSVESLTQATQGGIGIRVIVEGKVGYAYTGSLNDRDIATTLASARENVLYTTADPFAGLAEPDGHAYTELDLYSPSTTTYPLEQKIAMAIDLERHIRDLDQRILEIPNATYGDVVSEVAIASTTGILISARDTFAFAFAQALAQENDETQSGFGYSVGRSPEEIDITEAARDATDRATRLLGARKPHSRTITIIFEPRVTANLLSIVGSTLSAGSVQRRRSIFAHRLGEQIASPKVTLTDDPSDIRFQSASTFDGEGLATRTNTPIERGILASYFYDSYTARKDGTSSTGSAQRGGAGSTTPGPRALTLRPGQRSPDEMIKGTAEAVLVQSISGIHSGVNPISGDFSVGCEGVMIRGGEVAEGIKEATISSTLQRILQGICEIGNDQRFFPGVAAGSTLMIDEMNLSGS
jgi:PmbA protein